VRDEKRMIESVASRGLLITILTNLVKLLEVIKRITKHLACLVGLHRHSERNKHSVLVDDLLVLFVSVVFIVFKMTALLEQALISYDRVSLFLDFWTVFVGNVCTLIETCWFGTFSDFLRWLSCWEFVPVNLGYWNVRFWLSHLIEVALFGRATVIY